MNLHRSAKFPVLLILLILMASCSRSLYFSGIVDGPDGEDLILKPAETDLFCSESITLEPEGGMPPYSISLQKALGGVGEGLEETHYTAPSDQTGIVLIQLKDSYGSVVSSKITVVSGSGNTSLTLSPSTISIYLGKSAALVASGGTGGYSYALVQSIGGTGESLAGNLYTAPTDIGGTARIRVTDSKDHTADATVRVYTQSPAIPDVDYGLSALVHTGVAEGGGALTGNFTITNNGSEAGSETVSWSVYYSTDDTINSGDTIVSHGALSALGASPANTSVPFSGTWPYPEVDTTYYIIAAVQAYDDVDSLDNTASLAVPINAVIKPDVDYIVTGVTASFTTVTNSTAIDNGVGYNIYNRGDSDGTAAVSWSAYLSTDNEWDASDVLITGSEGSTTGMVSDSYYWVGLTGTWPSTTGNYYYIIKLSSTEDVNATNNYLALPVTIQ